mmetsp:Transcript_51585/g.57617  ORF Transcript_51585/g.57617 Transcript_51585/m.57617 type:complete len:824 (-) Transcript_51585:83-2554(-)
MARGPLAQLGRRFQHKNNKTEYQSQTTTTTTTSGATATSSAAVVYSKIATTTTTTSPTSVTTRPRPLATSTTTTMTTPYNTEEFTTEFKALQEDKNNDTERRRSGSGIIGSGSGSGDVITTTMDDNDTVHVHDANAQQCCQQQPQQQQQEPDRNTSPPPTNTSTTPPTNTTISQFDAMMHLMKGNLGPGCLNLPHAFAVSGWLLGMVLFLVVALQGIYSMLLLVSCKQYIRSHLQQQREAQAAQQQQQQQQQQQHTDRRQQQQQHTDSNDRNNIDVAGTIEEGGEIEMIVDETTIVTFMDIAAFSHGRVGSILVQVFLFILQGGVCCVFLSLIATNFHASLPQNTLHLDSCVFLVTLLLLVVVLVRDLKELKWLSLGANCLMILAIFTASFSAIAVLYQHNHHNDNDNNDNDNETAKLGTTNPRYIAMFVSSMFYSFEGIGLVMPIENSYVGYATKSTNNDNNEKKNTNQETPDGNTTTTCTNHDTSSDTQIRNPDTRIREASSSQLLQQQQQQEQNKRIASFLNPVLLGSMGCVGVLFLLIGITCGPAFPDIVEGSITAYLTTKYPNSKWYQGVNALVMVAVFFTFPLQLTPAMEVLQEWFGPGCDPQCDSCCFGFGVGEWSQTRTNNRNTTTTIANDGLLRLRRRHRPPSRRQQRRGGGGHHTPLSQQEEEEEDETVPEDELLPEEGEEGVDVMAVATEETNNSTTTSTPIHNESTPMNTNTNRNRHDSTTPTPPNTCFGTKEWIFRRYVVVICCAIIVLCVQDLGLLMSLFGAVGNTGLAAMPCLIHLQLMTMPTKETNTARRDSESSSESRRRRRRNTK